MNIQNNLINLENLINIKNGQALTSSLLIAEVFGKRHDDVLKAIRNLEIPEDYRSRNFAATSIAGKGNKKNTIMLLTRDGFTLLAMGFNGKKATEWKIKYLEAFNEMEKSLNAQRIKNDPIQTRIIEAFIRELGPYAPLYPDHFYQSIYGLLGWDYKGKNMQPGYMGKLTNQLIYSKLAPSVYEELNKRNPYQGARKRRKYIMTRLLTDDIGKQAVKEQINFVCRMAACVNSVEDLINIVERDYQNKFNGAKQLTFLKVRYELVDTTKLLN